jgi:hypothetical protein
MTNTSEQRSSIIDGSTETQEFTAPTIESKLEPVFETILVEIMTVFGIEAVVQKRLIGYRDRQEK